MTAEVRGLVDTNVLIRFGPTIARQLPAEFGISAVSVAELAAGVHAAPDDAQRASRLDLLQWAESEFEPIPFGVDAARAYGRIAAAAQAAGRSPRARVADQMIAATATAAGLVLYTANTADFTHLKDVLTVVAVRVR